MTISGALTTTFPKSAELQRTYPAQQPQQTAVPSQKTSIARRFDRVTISEATGGTFAMEARSRLANEVRTATSSGAVPALREEIRQGRYQPDSMEIARKMLLFGEGV